MAGTVVRESTTARRLTPCRSRAFSNFRT